MLRFTEDRSVFMAHFTIFTFNSSWNAPPSRRQLHAFSFIVMWTILYSACNCWIIFLHFILWYFYFFWLFGPVILVYKYVTCFSNLLRVLLANIVSQAKVCEITCPSKTTGESTLRVDVALDAVGHHEEVATMMMTLRAILVILIIFSKGH